MENKNLTAVEWLVEQLPQIDWDDPYYVGVLQEAKAMEKEQIMKANLDGFNECANYEEKSSEQYYNKTYDNNK